MGKNMGMFASLIVKGLRRNVTENVLAKKVSSVGVKVELSLAKLRSNLDWALLLFVFGTLNKGGKVNSVMGILYFMYFIFFGRGGIHSESKSELKYLIYKLAMDTLHTS